MRNIETIDLEVIILAKAEPSIYGTRNDISICVAGWSEHKGFVRIIPVRPAQQDLFKDWNVLSMEVEKDSKDTRFETYKIVNDRTIKLIKQITNNEEKSALIRDILTDTCVPILNEQRRSLAIIQPDESNTEYFYEQKEIEKIEHFEESLDKFLGIETIDKNKIDGNFRPHVQQDSPFDLRIKYRCKGNCLVKTMHNQKVIEYGIKLFVRKYPEKISNWGSNYKLDDKEYDKYFLIGNQRDNRTSWIIIKVFYFKKPPNKTLLYFTDSNTNNQNFSKRYEIIKDSIKNAGNSPETN